VSVRSGHRGTALIDAVAAYCTDRPADWPGDGFCNAVLDLRNRLSAQRRRSATQLLAGVHCGVLRADGAVLGVLGSDRYVRLERIAAALSPSIQRAALCRGKQ